jgi:hypothetical protein
MDNAAQTLALVRVQGTRLPIRVSLRPAVQAERREFEDAVMNRMEQADHLIFLAAHSTFSPVEDTLKAASTARLGNFEQTVTDFLQQSFAKENRCRVFLDSCHEGIWAERVTRSARAVSDAVTSHLSAFASEPVAARELKFRVFRQFLKAALSCPQFRGRLQNFIEQFRSTHFSHREFSRAHLTRFPGFEVLLRATSEEFGEIIREAAALLELLTKSVWKIAAKFLPKRMVHLPLSLETPVAVVNTEELWPLLMAFKNH